VIAAIEIQWNEKREIEMEKTHTAKMDREASFRRTK
jgi:hypothetical protein